jgi:hypothetical protein
MRRPEYVRRLKWHIKRDNFLFIIIYFKAGQVITIVTIQDYVTSFQSLYPSHTPGPVHEPQGQPSHKLGQEYEIGEEMGVDSMPLAKLVQH